MEREPFIPRTSHSPAPSTDSHKMWDRVRNVVPMLPRYRSKRRVSNIIDKSEDTSPKILLPHVIDSSFRHRLAFYLDSSYIGRMWELMDALVNLMLCICYVLNTFSFLPPGPIGTIPALLLQQHQQRNYEFSPVLGSPRKGLTDWQRNMEFSFALILLFQFLPRLYLAADRRRYLLSPISILTVLASVPVFTAYADPRVKREFMSAGDYAYMYPFRFMRLHLAIIQCLVPSKTSLLQFSLIARKAIKLLGFLLFLFLTVAAFLHVGTHMSQDVKDVSFFDAFYYAFVSATSGSASQIIPDSPFSRMIIVGVIISAAVFVPTNLAELLRLISNKSVYDHSFKQKTGQNHVIVCGQFEVGSINTFLKEFFCPDHGNVTVNSHVVILSPNEPNEEMKMILGDPMYMNRVQYVIGSVVNPRSLEKVRIHEANACFIFSSKFATASASEDDAATVMRALALKKQIPGLPLHIQVILPEHKVHFDYLADAMICVEELKLGMLAQNCRCPGFSTLMHMLTTSITETLAKSLLARVKEDKKNEWISEYLDGANQEIYPTVISDGFAGYTFAEVSAMIFCASGAVTIALGIPNDNYKKKMNLRDRLDLILETNPEIADHVNPNVLRIDGSDFELYINPGSFIVKGGELAFLIASEEHVARKISEYCPTDFVDMTGTNEVDTVEHIKELVDSAPAVLEPNGLITILKDTLADSPANRSAMSLSSGKSYRNHRIITTTGSREQSVVLSPTEVKELLKGNSQGLKEFSSPEKHENLVIPAKTPTVPGQTDILPSSLFENERGESSSQLSASTDTLNFDQIQQSQQEQQKQEVGSTSNLVGRILSQAIGISRHKKSLSTASADSSNTEQASFKTTMEIDNHILICDASSTFPANLEYFIAPLRSSHLRSDSSAWDPIVILTPAEPTVHQRNLLDQFEDVYIMKGNPIIRRDLSRAAVDRCNKAIVLANSTKGKHFSERTADADSLLILLNIESMCTNKDLFVMTECIHEENMAFIGPSGFGMNKISTKEKQEQTLMRPSFMSGHVFCISMLDSVICQNYFNPHMLNIVRHLLFSGSFTASSSMSGGDLHSHIWLLKLPDSLVHTKYSDVFMFLAKEYHAVPIGLYRETEIQNRTLGGSGKYNKALVSALLKGALWDVPMHLFDELPTDNSANTSTTGKVKDMKNDGVKMTKHRYVYLNPDPKTRIKKGDCVYILSNKPIKL